MCSNGMMYKVIFHLTYHLQQQIMPSFHFFEVFFLFGMFQYFVLTVLNQTYQKVSLLLLEVSAKIGMPILLHWHFLYMYSIFQHLVLLN